MLPRGTEESKEVLHSKRSPRYCSLLRTRTCCWRQPWFGHVKPSLRFPSSLYTHSVVRHRGGAPCVRIQSSATPTVFHRQHGMERRRRSVQRNRPADERARGFCFDSEIGTARRYHCVRGMDRLIDYLQTERVQYVWIYKIYGVVDKTGFVCYRCNDHNRRGYWKINLLTMWQNTPEWKEDRDTSFPPPLVPKQIRRYMSKLF